jgi:hypothetical protein
VDSVVTVPRNPADRPTTEPRTEAEPMFYLWHTASNNAIGYGTLQEMVKERDAELEANPGTQNNVLIMPDPAEAAQGAAPLDRFDNTTEACRHCPTPDVHPTRIGGILTYEGRCDPDTCEKHDHSELSDWAAPRAEGLDGGCYFCGASGIAPHPTCPAGNVPQPTDEEIERWYRAFDKVACDSAKTAEGRRLIFEEFATEYARLSGDEGAGE